MDNVFSDFPELSSEFSVIMPSPLTVPDFRDLFMLPQKRKKCEEACGYPISRLEVPPPSDFLCMICQNVVRKPLECRKCSKLYCMNCLNAHQKLNSAQGVVLFACSLCGCTQEPVHPSQILIRIISELRIKCMNFEAGCQTYTTIEDITRHNIVCAYREVMCENYRSCRKIGLIRDFIESEGAIRHPYSYLTSRVHGMHKTYLCSEKCRIILEFDKLVSEKKNDKAMLEYFNLLNKIMKKKQAQEDD